MGTIVRGDVEAVYVVPFACNENFEHSKRTALVSRIPFIGALVFCCETSPSLYALFASHQNGMSSSVAGATLAIGAAGVVLWALCESAGMTLGVLGAFVNCQPDRPFDSHRPR